MVGQVKGSLFCLRMHVLCLWMCDCCIHLHVCECVVCVVCGVLNVCVCGGANPRNPWSAGVGESGGCVKLRVLKYSVG